MADWRTYAKAAQRTAQRQGPEVARQIREARERSAHSREAGGSLGARDYLRAARTALDEGTRESREGLRRDAAAYAAVTERRARAGAEHVRRMSLKRRLIAAGRDAVLFGLALFAIWFVLSRAGLMIPASALIAVIAVLMVVRFGYALLAKRDTTIGQNGQDPQEPPRRTHE